MHVFSSAGLFSICLAGDNLILFLIYRAYKELLVSDISVERELALFFFDKFVKLIPPFSQL